MKRKIFLSTCLTILSLVFLSQGIYNAYAELGDTFGDVSSTPGGTSGGTDTATNAGSTGGVGSVLSKYADGGGGAAWVYYAWPANANEVRVNGSSSFGAAKGYTITGNDAAICRDAGGYFVHGLISKNTHKQVGALSIGNNYAAPEWNSVRFGGQTQYHTNYSTIVGGTGVSWEQAEAAWNAANSKYNFSLPWKDTAWFCASYAGGSTQSITVYTDNDTHINTDVKVADKPFDPFTSTVWAGVGQTVRFRHIYQPNVQKYANQAVTRGYNGSDPSSYLAGQSCKILLPYSRYSFEPETGGWADFPNNNTAFKNAVAWQNQFVINRNFGSQLGPFGYSIGDYSMQIQYDDVTVGSGNVNGTLVESATTGYPTSAWRTVKADFGDAHWRCDYTRVKKVKKCVANCPCPGKDVLVSRNCEWVVHQQTGDCNGGYWHPGRKYTYDACPTNPYSDPCHSREAQEDPYWVCTSYADASWSEEVCTENWSYHACIEADVDATETVQSHSYSNRNVVASYGTNGTTTVTSSPAQVLIPMNYALSSDIDLGSGVAYAGELLSVGNARVYNNARYNGVTGSTYSTNAYGKYKLISYTSNRDETGSGWTASGNVCAGKANCIQGAESDGFWINANSSYPVNGKFGSINIPDIPAGNYICIALAYWPTDSGDYTNMGNYNGNGVWGVSNPACRVIAKKPTFQVWGGSLYTAGALSLPAAYKTSLAGVAGREYTINGRNKVTVFSSWVDQIVSGAKTVAELASGAATTGGSYEGANAANGYCTFRTPLSLANWANNNPKLCPTALYTGSMPSSNVIDRKALAESLAKGNANVSTGTINLNNAGHYTTVKADSGRDVRYSYRSTGLTLQGGTVNAGITHVVRSDADVVITGNIEYQNIAYSKLEQIPKLVIYAKNIKINCGVKRVDAVLLAESEINTCADSTDVNAQKNSNQLKINGIIVTNKLKLNRTYGAATGVNSAVPAEIIDYDTSLILWAAASATVSGSNSFNVTYQRELAPRY